MSISPSLLPLLALHSPGSSEEVGTGTAQGFVLPAEAAEPCQKLHCSLQGQTEPREPGKRKSKSGAVNCECSTKCRTITSPKAIPTPAQGSPCSLQPIWQPRHRKMSQHGSVIKAAGNCQEICLGTEVSLELPLINHHCPVPCTRFKTENRAMRIW